MQTINQSTLYGFYNQKQQVIGHYRALRRPWIFFERHTQAIERILAVVWKEYFSEGSSCLIAVGGFGRGEMYPYSDLDLALVFPKPLTAGEQERAAAFVQTLWDMQLIPAVKIGSIGELCESVKTDITGDTAFLEARWLFGNRKTAEKLLKNIYRQRDIDVFIEAKLVEIQQRHAKSQGSGSVLEPNIKTCPGGLRDIHTILWLLRAQGLGTSLDTLFSQNILTRTEVAMLSDSHRKLAAIRIDLHLAAGRVQDRLIFDLQQQVAENMGWSDDEYGIKSEKLMRVFYRAGKTVMRLNGILLPLMCRREHSVTQRIVCKIDSQYYQIGNQLAVYNDKLFECCPEHLFKAVEILQSRSDITAFCPKTLRSWWMASRKINFDFYNCCENRRRFVGFFKHGEGLTRVMRFLNLYGVLERYLPEWGKIVGLLQHDLFHVYPVDDHILTVLHNVRRLVMDSHSHELPFASALMHTFEHKHILYLAALFHDIAKGRGGNHAEEGMIDARRFADDHFLSEQESSLLIWLVQDHLLMSAVAQKEDIQNPDVISRFCARVQTYERLVALYLLTVSDIRGTNPKLWNGWRASLLENLFHTAARYLAGAGESRNMMLSRRQQSAAGQLTRAGIPEKQQRQLWQVLGQVYFVSHEIREILWHTANLVYQTEQPQVRSRMLSENGVLQVMIFMPNAAYLFARLCRIFSHHRLDILAARAFVTEHNYILDTFIVQLPSEACADYLNVQSVLEASLNYFIYSGCIAADNADYKVRSRRSRYLPIAPNVRLAADMEDPGWYTLEIVAVNRPYLLADIAEVLSEYNISLRYAKVATLDERAEDSFRIFGPHLDNPKNQLVFKQALLAQLSSIG